MRQGRRRTGDPVLQAVEDEDLEAEDSAIAKPAEDMPGSVANRAGNFLIWIRPAGVKRIPAGLHQGVKNGWSIKHNLQKTAKRAGSPG